MNALQRECQQSPASATNHAVGLCCPAAANS